MAPCHLGGTWHELRCEAVWTPKRLSPVRLLCGAPHTLESQVSVRLEGAGPCRVGGMPAARVGMPSGLQPQARLGPTQAPTEPRVPGGAGGESFLQRPGAPGLHKSETRPIDINNHTNNDAVTLDKDKNEYFSNSDTKNNEPITIRLYYLKPVIFMHYVYFMYL